MAELHWPWNLLGVIVVPIVVPVVVGLLALLWPWWQERQRRAMLQRLVHAELLEAGPNPETTGTASSWTAHLTRRFLHETFIGDPTSNATVVLSLSPELSYNLAQLWTAFHKAEAAFVAQQPDEGAALHHANQWCWYLHKTCAYLDKWRPRGRSRPKPVSPIARQWHRLLSEHYPSVPPSADGQHLHLMPERGRSFLAAGTNHRTPAVG